MSNTLLVIGNGFDLALEAKTRYRDFFESETYKPVKDYISQHYSSLLAIQMRGGNIFYDKSKFTVTCWDVLFCLKSKKGERLDTSSQINWCDVEQTMFESLVNHGSKGDSYWERVFKEINYYRIHDNQYFTQNIEIDAMVAFCIDDGKWVSVDDIEVFNKLLLGELQVFESRFGKYIYDVTNDEDYKKNAIKFANGLSNRKTCYIDSFNYSDFSTDMVKIRHINGNTDNPIFGVDVRAGSNNDYCDNHFYKTSRRIYQDSYNISAFFPWKISFNQVIVYGHSLNKMDYDYFYYIFTMLKFNTFNSQEMGTIEFLFDIYDSNKDENIRDSFSEEVYRLLEQYENSISSNNQHILINLLRFSGKLIIREIVVEDVKNIKVKGQGISY